MLADTLGIFPHSAEGLSKTDLIHLHNRLQSALHGAKGKELRYWKDKTEALAVKVEELLVAEREARAAAEAARSKRIEAAKNHLNANTIRDAALALLCEVAYYEDKTKKNGPDNRADKTEKNARSVGLAYDTIVARIIAQFPGAKTSLACLRWYCVKVRVGEHGFTGYVLPQRRPRVGQQ